MTRFFKVGFVLGKPWAWIKDADADKQTNPKYVDKNDKHKVNNHPPLKKLLNFQYLEMVKRWYKFPEGDKYINLQGLTGYTLDLLEELSRSMKFDYEVVIASDNEYGYRYNLLWPYYLAPRRIIECFLQTRRH